MRESELLDRGLRTLSASWEAYARRSPGAGVARLAGATAAVFPTGPEAEFLNNVVMETGMPPGRREAALDTVERHYARSGVPHYAVWVVGDDQPLRESLARRGYVVDASTLAMGAELSDLDLPTPAPDLLRARWTDYSAAFLPAGMLAGLDPGHFVVALARPDGPAVSAALAYDHLGDRGIYNVETLAPARRRGLATSLTGALLHAARDLGLTTASLQATPAAERLYAALGFRGLARIVEYVPSSG